jgi:hypothetical protein
MAESFHRCMECGGRVLDFSLCPHCERDDWRADHDREAAWTLMSDESVSEDD